jgi:D-alanyl-D-alanine carboxypeptidase
MDETAYEHLCDMFTDAKAAGYTLRVASSYRSYIDQYIIYNDYVKRDGQAAADRYSARPGHSEHQSGLAFDLNSLEQNFGETKEGIWLAEHCHEFGFIIRYPADKEEITGYMYEPWHIRYVGADLAKTLTESGQCLEEYFGIQSYYEY